MRNIWLAALLLLVVSSCTKSDENGAWSKPDGIEVIYCKGIDGMRSFHIGKYEITQAQWTDVMGYNPSEWQDPALPVTNVSWYDAQEFVARLREIHGRNWNLPTDAEWEYAARGGSHADDYAYAGGERLNDVAWWRGNSDGIPHKVGTKRANSVGIHDMSGNVYEWCEDWFDHRQNLRSLRGGSWDSESRYCIIYNTDGENPENYYNNCGFRVVLYD